MISDFSFGGRAENRYGMAFEFVSGLDFRCVLQHFSNLTPFKEVLGPSLAGKRPKPKLKFKF